MPLEPLKVGTTSVGLTQTPDTGTTTATQKSGAATFFKDIGKKMASVAKAIGDGISSLAPKHKPTSESLSPGSKAAFANFRELAKKLEKLEKLDNPTPSQQAKLQQVKDDYIAARREAIAHIREQFENGPLYAAAKSETNKGILSHGDFKAPSPEQAVSDALDTLVMSKRIDEVLKKGMKVDEAVAIVLYTGGCYGGINRELRGGKPSEFIQQISADVTSGLSRLPPFEEPVYRIASLPPSVDQHYHEGATVVDRGIMSTTFNVDFDLYGGGTSHVMSIVGHGDSAGRDISWLSEVPKEKEVMFPPGTEFIVKQRDQAEMPKVIQTLPDGTQKFDSQVGLLLVQKPK